MRIRGLVRAPIQYEQRYVIARCHGTSAPTSEIAAAAMTPLAADILVCPLALNLQEPIVLVNVYIGPIHCTPFFTSCPGPSPASTTGGRPVFLGMFAGTFMMPS